MYTFKIKWIGNHTYQYEILNQNGKLIGRECRWPSWAEAEMQARIHIRKLKNNQDNK